MKILIDYRLVTTSAVVALAAALEYTMGEVLELAGNTARDNNRVRAGC